MSTPPRCRLTAKDFSILEAMARRDARDIPYTGAFLRLLRHKLAIATVIFPDDVEPTLATIDSHVDFTVDGRLSGSGVLTRDDSGTDAAPRLPITLLRGLALLGLTAGDTIAVAGPDGAQEDLRLDRVRHQPEADLRREKAAVVAFTARRRPAPPRAETRADPADPDDDDPGPRAA